MAERKLPIRNKARRQGNPPVIAATRPASQHQQAITKPRDEQLGVKPGNEAWHCLYLAMAWKLTWIRR